MEKKLKNCFIKNEFYTRKSDKKNQEKYYKMQKIEDKELNNFLK